MYGSDNRREPVNHNYDIAKEHYYSYLTFILVCFFIANYAINYIIT